MGAKIASFLATLILSIPLAAIGLMAVFGIPQLVPANGEPGNAKETVIRGVRDAFNWGNSPESKPAADADQHFDDAPRFGDDTHVHDEPMRSDNRYASNTPPESAFDAPAHRPWNDRPETSSASREFEKSPSSRHWSDIPTMSTDQSMSSAALREPAGSSSRAGFDGPAHSSKALENRSAYDDRAPLLTWRQASLRLAELGVKNYHLERGAAEGSFLFVCIFSPGDAPHVVHRFEAETDDPLLAVNQVLQQVDRWMSSRYASANFPTKPQSFSMTSGSQRQ